MDEVTVLDHGFVRLVDVMGDDQRIVQAARVSYGAGTKSVREDRGLIRYLMRHKHTSPFEMVEFTFHLKMPVFVARQHIRHRTANVNEISGRYSVINDEFYIPDVSRMQKQSTDNKQGSSSELISNPEMEVHHLEVEDNQAYEAYKDRINAGMARELARINLPLSMYTEMYWKIDLHNLLHYLRLRLDDHAQYEIRVFAQAMYDLIKERVPLACEAFEDYALNSMTLSAAEVRLLGNLILRYPEFVDVAEEELVEEALPSKGERDEFLVKYSKFFSHLDPQTL